MKKSRVPWTERMSRLRAPLDVVTGCYPAFAFGGRLNPRILPVFHFHEVTAPYLEPYLHYLRENGYRSGTVEDLMKFLRTGEPLPARTVLLTFDDAWSSLWTVAAPLLRRFDFQAITFAVPARVSDRDGVRPTIEESEVQGSAEDSPEEPFCRWDELMQLDREGVVEVESHTFAHEQIPVARCEVQPVWSDEHLQATPLLSKPLVWEGTECIRPFDEREVGLPRWVTRSRMSDARRWIPEENRPESFEEARCAIRRDLAMCREKMETKLNRPARILCFPWAVAGKVARREARDIGYHAAFSDSFPGKRYVHRGADPFRLMRLKHEWIFHLPGQGRRRLWRK